MREWQAQSCNMVELSGATGKGQNRLARRGAGRQRGARAGAAARGRRRPGQPGGRAALGGAGGRRPGPRAPGRLQPGAPAAPRLAARATAPPCAHSVWAPQPRVRWRGTHAAAPRERPTLLYTLYHAAAGWGPGADGAGRAGLHRRRRAAPLQRLPAARLLPRAPTAQRDRRRCAARDGLPRQGGRPPATFRLRDMLAREWPACVIDLTRGDWPFSSSRLVPTQDWCEAHPVPPWHAPLRGQAGKKSRRGAERPAQHASGSGCGRARRQPSSQQRGGRRGARDSRAPAPT